MRFCARVGRGWWCRPWDGPVGGLKDLGPAGGVVLGTTGAGWDEPVEETDEGCDARGPVGMPMGAVLAPVVEMGPAEGIVGETDWLLALEMLWRLGPAGQPPLPPRAEKLPPLGGT